MIEVCALDICYIFLFTKKRILVKISAFNDLHLLITFTVKLLYFYQIKCVELQSQTANLVYVQDTRFI